MKKLWILGGLMVVGLVASNSAGEDGVSISPEERSALIAAVPATASRQGEVDLITHVRVGASLKEVRCYLTPRFALAEPTRELEVGELPAGVVRVEFSGPHRGYLYFEGSVAAVGALLQLEVLTDSGDYSADAGKTRIRELNTLLGKPLWVRKYLEPNDETGLYWAQWSVDGRRVTYRDTYELGSVLSVGNLPDQD